MSLKQVRKQRELSQSQLARLSGVNIRTIQGYEQETKDINKAQFVTLLRLSIALSCNIESIVTDSNLIELVRKYSY